MQLKKAKDCNCGFPKTLYGTHTRHGHWCKAHERLMKKLMQHGEWWFDFMRRAGAKDEYGRWAAGVGPEPREDDW